MRDKKMTGYHAASWNEPIIYELGNKGRRGSIIQRIEEEVEAVVGDVVEHLPDKMQRKKLPKLPELSEPPLPSGTD